MATLLHKDLWEHNRAFCSPYDLSSFEALTLILRVLLFVLSLDLGELQHLLAEPSRPFTAENCQIPKWITHSEEGFVTF